MEKFDDVDGGMGIEKCRLCGQEFKTKDALQAHLDQKHKNDDWSHAGAAKHVDIKKKMGLESKNMNKSYKVIAKAIMNGDIGKVDFPTESLEPAKKLTIKEIAKIVKEEFGKVKDVNTMKLPPTKHFKDAKLAKEINWVDELDLKEFVIKEAYMEDHDQNLLSQALFDYFLAQGGGSKDVETVINKLYSADFNVKNLHPGMAKIVMKALGSVEPGARSRLLKLFGVQSGTMQANPTAQRAAPSQNMMIRKK